MEIAIPLFDRFTALDAIGPYEVLSRLPGARVRFLGPSADALVRTESRMLTVAVDGAWEDVPAPDVLLVPGGVGTRALLGDERVLAWVRQASAAAGWTASVCTGSLVLAAAGLLDGLEATTHWSAMDRLGALGARPVARRVVEQGTVLTAAGVSAGIDLALLLAARIAGDATAQAIQLQVEYDPQPPFATGSVATAPPAIRALAAEREGAHDARP
jgi:putative intracellular protease/amidase